MKQYERRYMKDPMFLMGISYGLMKAALAVETVEDIQEYLYDEGEYYKQEAQRKAKETPTTS